MTSSNKIKQDKIIYLFLSASTLLLLLSTVISYTLSKQAQKRNTNTRAEVYLPPPLEEEQQNLDQAPPQEQQDTAQEDKPTSGTPIKSCMKITAPGNYYLQNDLETSKDMDNCLTIIVSDVTLDGQSNRITTFQNQFQLNGIYVDNVHNVKISNFKGIHHFKHGIIVSGSFSGAGNIVIENNTITNFLYTQTKKSTTWGYDWKKNPFKNNLSSGISLGNVNGGLIRNNFVENNSNGIEAYYSKDLTIEGNNVSNNYNDTKFFDYDICLKFTNGTDADKESCRKCLTTGNCGPFLGDVPAAGIWLERTTDSRIEGNIGHNLSTGIALYDKSENNTIKNNDISDNSAFGIHLYQSSNNNIEKNTANNVLRYCSAMCNTSLGYDTCYKGCDAAGILVEESSNNNTIQGNTAQYSGDGLFQRSWDITCSNDNKIINNDFSFAQTNCLETSFCNGNQIIGNKLNSCGANGKYGMGIGLWAGFNTNMLVKDNEITNNGNGGGGIFIEHSNHNVIQNNTIKNNDTGMKLWATKNISFFYYNQSWNYNPYLRRPDFLSSDYIISGNTLTGNGVGAIISSTTDSRIENNIFNNTQNIRIERPSDAVGEINNISVTNNNLSCNPSCLSVINNQSKDLSFLNNYWGTTDQNTIQSMIYDGTKNHSLGKINYIPFNTSL